MASGRDDRVHARAIREAGVHHRARLVHPAPKRGEDPVDHVQEVRIVVKRASTRAMRPRRSTNTRSGPQTITSVTAGSRSSGSSGPRPSASLTTAATSASRASAVRMRRSSAISRAPPPGEIDGGR